MPVNSTIKTKSLKQLIANLLVDADVPRGSDVYVVKAPVARLSHKANDTSCVCRLCNPPRASLSMYGVQFTEGVGIVTEAACAGRVVKEVVTEDGKTKVTERPMTPHDLAKAICDEFPDYTFETLN